MAIQKMTNDLNIIQKLDDEPNDVGGLTAADLKAKFDEGSNTIKDYINNTLIPSIDEQGYIATRTASVKVPEYGWTSGSDGTWSQKVNVDIVKADDAAVVVSLHLDGSAADADAEIAYRGNVFRAKQEDGSSTLCAKKKPGVDVSIDIAVVEGGIA